MTNTTQSEAREMISLEEARARIDNKDITQQEIATLARLYARKNGLHKARKMSRTNVSMFLTARLRPGHVFDALEATIQDLLHADIAADVDNA